MFYPDKFETKLGFDKIRAMLKGAVLCPLGSARIDQMKFMTKRSDIEYELALVKEMIEILQESKTPMPTDGFFDLTEQLKRLRLNGTFLEAEDLFSLRRSLGAIIDLVKFFNPKEEEGRKTFPLMKAITADVIVFPDLCRRIDRTLTPTGEIKDNASPVLADIRRQLASTVSSISRLLNNILRSAQSDGIVDKDVTPTLRDGRLVIPILPSNKRKIRGIVHDESATGKTLYVEPAEVVEANNRIRELEGEERQEIIRILTAIANEIRPMLPDIMASFDFMGTVDFVRAKAKFAERIEATVPQMSSDGSLDWIHAKHPLLYIRYKSEGKASEIVPLDIMLDRRNQRIVLISGPNAGGKSVCLETLGLVQYMLQCGIAIPVAANSLCTIFDNIFIDIGDEQSIDNDLSTYSSHLQNMKFFVRNATKRTLILIDEFGSGTEPQIGGAIAQALLGKFNEAKVNGVITTHFSNLKHFAEETPGIVNGAMLYDRNGLRPLFKLEIGHPGSSFAIEIAHKIGLPQDVIEAAKEIVGSDYVNMDKYLQDISRDKRYWEQKRQKIHQQEKDLEEKMAKVDEKASELKSKRQEVLQKARDEASALLKEANARIERTIKDIKEAQAEKEATRSVRKKLDNFKEKVTEKAAADTTDNKPKAAKAKTNKQVETTRPFLVGDNVRLKGQTTIGQIVSVNGRQCQVTFGMIRSNLDMSRIEHVNRSQIRQEAQSNMLGGVHDPSVSDEIHQRRLNFKHEIDLRGMRADEALSAVTLYIDDAMLLDINQVRILHGTGTGALRQAIRTYLSSLKGSVNFHDEHVQFGGAGVTVVEIL